MIEEFLMRVGNIALLSAVPALALFVFFYGVRSNWRAHRVGRALFWFATSLLAVVALIAVYAFFGDWPGRPVVRLFVFTGVSFTIWRMFFELIRIQRSGKLPEELAEAVEAKPEQHS